MRDIVTTPNAPSSPFYSQAVRAGGFIFVSGLVGIDIGNGKLIGASIQEQTRQALENCRVVLEAAGGSLEDVVEVGVLLNNPEDISGMNEEYQRWFPVGPPTRYVAKLGVELPGVLVSIRVTAYIE